MGPVSEDAPTRQPISVLPMRTAHPAEGDRRAPEHLDTLRPAPPHGIDEAILHGALATFTRTRDDLEDLEALFTEQRRRWRRETLGTRHPADVEHYCALVEEERTLLAAILTPAEELAHSRSKSVSLDLTVIHREPASAPHRRGTPDRTSFASPA